MIGILIVAKCNKQAVMELNDHGLGSHRNDDALFHLTDTPLW
jgi:hypothetical protein